jgi:hypothetical protein
MAVGDARGPYKTQGGGGVTGCRHDHGTELVKEADGTVYASGGYYIRVCLTCGHTWRSKE